MTSQISLELGSWAGNRKGDIMRNHLLSALGFICLMIFLMLFYSWILNVVDMNTNHIASEWVKARHRYHGIQMSMEYRGEQYFYNKKGQKCKL